MLFVGSTYVVELLYLEIKSVGSTSSLISALLYRCNLETDMVAAHVVFL